MFNFYIGVTPNCQRQIDIAINTVSSHYFFPIFISNTDVRYRYAKGKPRTFHDGNTAIDLSTQKHEWYEVWFGSI